MKRPFLFGAAAFLLGTSLMGCSNTEKGLEKDAAINGQKVSQATQKATENISPSIKEGAKNATAALEVTPKVKNAITADSQLSDKRNQIDVDSANGTVHLKGHVVNNEMKKRAGEIAQKT